MIDSKQDRDSIPFPKILLLIVSCVIILRNLLITYLCSVALLKIFGTSLAGLQEPHNRWPHSFINWLDSLRLYQIRRHNELYSKIFFLCYQIWHTRNNIIFQNMHCQPAHSLWRLFMQQQSFTLNSNKPILLDV